MAERAGHKPALDGLRGLAVIVVILDHAWGHTFPGGGIVGVDLFFALSGYLITGLLAAEWDRTGTINLGGFYERRARRLLPALLAMVVAVPVISAAVGGIPAPTAGILFALFYLTDLAVAGGASTGLAHTWSLSVEEQFYLCWPLALRAMLSRGFDTARIVRVLAVASLAGTAIGALLFASGVGFFRVYVSPAPHIASVAAGCALALVGVEPWVQRLGPLVWAAPVLLGVVMVEFAERTWAAPLCLGGYLAVSALTAAMVVGAEGPMRRSLSGPVLRWFGRRSYAIYLWHEVLIVAAVHRAGQLTGADQLVIVAVTLAVAEMSWRVVERPFRARRPSPVTAG